MAHATWSMKGSLSPAEPLTASVAGPQRHLVIRDCDVSWIGGGHQTTLPDGTPVRFGNGIEFWENAHDILVEGCRIWEIYDAALTNQGSRDNAKLNITYRDNVIWNSEYSFEFWNRGPVVDHARYSLRAQHMLRRGTGLGPRPAPRPQRPPSHVLREHRADVRGRDSRQHLRGCDRQLPAHGQRLEQESRSTGTAGSSPGEP